MKIKLRGEIKNLGGEPMVSFLATFFFTLLFTKRCISSLYLSCRKPLKGQCICFKLKSSLQLVSADLCQRNFASTWLVCFALFVAFGLRHQISSSERFISLVWALGELHNTYTRWVAAFGHLNTIYFQMIQQT